MLQYWGAVALYRRNHQGNEGTTSDTGSREFNGCGSLVLLVYGEIVRLFEVRVSVLRLFIDYSEERKERVSTLCNFSDLHISPP